MTALEKQMAEALRLANEYAEDGDWSRVKGCINLALAKFDAQAAEQAAGNEKTVCPYCQSEWVTGEQHDRNLAAHLAKQAEGGGEVVPVQRFDEHLRRQVKIVLEGWTLPSDARKVLEAALYATPIPSPAPAAPSDAQQAWRKLTQLTHDQLGPFRRALADRGVYFSDETCRELIAATPHTAPSETPAAPVQICDCGKKPAAECEKWEPGCDLGQSAEHARVVRVAAPVQQVVDLSPLPTEWRKVEDADGIEVPVFRAFQMHAYARAALSTRPEMSDAEIDALRMDAERLDYLITQPDDGPALIVWKQDYKNEPFTTLRACGSINVTGHFEDVRDAIDAALAARGEKR